MKLQMSEIKLCNTETVFDPTITVGSNLFTGQLTTILKKVGNTVAKKLNSK
jgi:hypothetical protein